MDSLRTGDALRLVPDPTGEEDPEVWVLLASGDPVGHLPPEVARWLGPWLRQGGVARAVAARVGAADEPSWRRVVLSVTCLDADDGD